MGVRADLLYQQFADEHSGNFREYGGLLNGTIGLPLGIARPYAIAGVGLINHNPPSEDHGDHAHEGEGGTEFAWNVGGGIRFGLGGLNVFAEARLLDAGAGHRAVPITFGISF